MYITFIPFHSLHQAFTKKFVDQCDDTCCMTYCRTEWHFCKASDARKLERVQEQTLHTVYGNRMAEYEGVLTQAKLPSLVNRRL